LELRKLARMLAESALDLVAQVMEVDARLADSRAAEAFEVGRQQRDVQKGKERLGDRLGDGKKPLAAACREEEGLHEKREP
jgi:hypothetical protein